MGKVVAFSKTATGDENLEWSWDAATQNAILGDAGDNWAEYERAHTWWDGDGGKKAAYKLPHHKMVDGKLTAIWHGVTAAMARLSQSDIPEGDMHGCFDHLAKHYDQWGKEPPEWDRFVAGVRERRARTMKAERSGIALPAFVMTRAPLIVNASRQNGQPTDDDMAYIAQQLRGDVPADALYVLATESSNAGIDSYYTQMTPQTLQWYCEDATRGVAFCDSHDHWQLPIGRTFYGAVSSRALEPGDTLPADASLAQWPGGLAVTGNTSGDLMTANLLTYMLRGMALSSGMNSNDVIRGIGAGIYSDISVGFKPLAYWCSVCGLDMLRDWDCMHWPGQTYEVKDAATGETRQVLCLARIDARLSEHSLVYDGATPNAMTLKAQRALDAGRVDAAAQRNIRLVEEHCRVKLLPQWQGFGPSQQTTTAHSMRTLRPIISNEEVDTMRGSEFVARFMQVSQDEATRAGKKMSADDLASLQTIHDNLRAGHDTMDDAMRDLAGFMAAQNAASSSDTAPEGNTDSASNPGAGDGKTAVGDLPGDGGTNSQPLATGETRASDGLIVRADGSHDAMSGSHSHDHPTYGSQGGDAGHDHMHTHDNDASHNHSHATQNSAPSAVPGNMTPEQRAIFEAGAHYLAQIRDDAIGWAVRAGVAKTPEEEAKWRGMLARFTPEETETLTAEWARQAGQRFSPRGRFTPDRTAAGNGSWSSEPTNEGGVRQTQASDPNNPQRLPTRGAQSQPNGNTPATRDDARLYSLNGGKGKARR